MKNKQATATTATTTTTTTSTSEENFGTCADSSCGLGLKL